MSYLEKFNDDERDLLVALPYRTGLWISASDGGGGQEAAQAEIEALDGLVTGYAEDFCKSALVEELMRETLARRDRWKSWHKDIALVPTECRKAISVLMAQVGNDELESFRHTLTEIAMAVAAAHREIGDAPALTDRLRAYARYAGARMTAMLKKIPAPSLDDSLNISRAESAALKALAEALGA